MSSATLKRVVAVIRSATGVGNDEVLDSSTPLVGAGISLDSVAVVELLVALEKEFDIEIPGRLLLEAKAFRTIGTLVQFIESQAGRER